MRKNYFFTILVSILLMLQFQKVTAQQGISPSLDSTLQHCIDSLRIAYQLKGITAAAYIPGSGMWEGVSGVSYSNVAIDSSMILNIGSVTKTYVAAEIFKLIESGQLLLDDSIGGILSPVNYVNPNITIRQLLGHKSGLAEYLNTSWQNAMNANLYKVWYAPEALDSFLTAATGVPGSAFAYRNTNYELLGMIIETLTGDSLHHVLRNNFITPLNLNDTYMEVFEQYPNTVPHNWSTPSLNPNLAVDSWNVPRIALSSSTEAAGGLFATASDLAWWGYNLYSGNVINNSSLSEMLTFTNVGGGYFNGYGLGCMRFPGNGRTYWGHAGNFFGFAACMLYYPQDSITVAVLINIDCYGSNIAKPLINEVINNLPTGLQGQESTTSFLVYPNPTASVLHIVSNQNRSQIVKTELYNMIGKMTDQYTDMDKINLTGLENGIYFLKIFSGNSVHTEKIIVHH